jgi:hypothetical protein
LAPQALFLLSGLMVEQFWPSPINVNGFGVERYAADSEADASSEELYRIVAPGFLWRASWGEPPLITTPEGVSRRPVAFAILPGLPLNVYNPYDARLDDPAFVNYQASRIMTREWKMEVSAADVERACHATRHGRISRWCLLDQIGTKRAPPRAWLFVRLWLLCVISLFSIQLPSNPASRRKPLRWLSLLWSAPTLLVLPMAIDQVSKHDPTGLASYPFRVAVLLGELTRLVERAPIVFGGLGLVLLGYYALVERTFVGTEGFIGRRNSQRSAR